MDLVNDPQVVENDYLIDFDHPTMGRIKMPGYPVHFSESWAQISQAAPEVGEHTDEILTELAGLTPEEIEALREEGVV